MAMVTREQVVQAVMCGKANLSGMDLRGLDLSGLSLRGVDLRGTDLAGAKLTNCDLDGALLDKRTVLDKADLRGVRAGEPDSYARSILAGGGERAALGMKQDDYVRYRRLKQVLTINGVRVKDATFYDAPDRRAAEQMRAKQAEVKQTGPTTLKAYA